MNAQSIRLAIAVLAATLAAPAAIAQAPPPKAPPVKAEPPPQLALRWLAGIGVAPARVTAGSKGVVTVTLLRPAFNDLTVGLSVSPGHPEESGLWIAADAVFIVPASLRVPKGQDRASFEISTRASGLWSGTRTFTLGASYGGERVSTTFTVAYPN
jgi:hypothetical protein